MKKIKLSFTQINKVLNNPRQWYYEYFLGQWHPPTDYYMIQGSAFHKVCEDSLGTKLNGKTAAKIYHDEFNKNLWKAKHLKDTMAENGEYLEKFRREEGLQMAFNMIDYLNKMEGGQVEEKFNYEVDDLYDMGGLIDRILPSKMIIEEKKEGRRKFHAIKDFEDGVTLIDYKTASFKNYNQHDPSKSLQLFIYAYWYYLNFYQIPEIAYIIALRDKDFSKIIIKKYQPTLENLRWAESKIQEAVNMIHRIIFHEEAPFCQSNIGVGLCSPKWCTHWKQCQENAELAYNVKIKKQWEDLKKHLETNV